jgi:hypothetical protein
MLSRLRILIRPKGQKLLRTAENHASTDELKSPGDSIFQAWPTPSAVADTALGMTHDTWRADSAASGGSFSLAMTSVGTVHAARPSKGTPAKTSRTVCVA